MRVLAFSGQAFGAFLGTSEITLADDLPLEIQVGILRTAVDAFEKECVRDGALREDVSWCVDERIRLEQDKERIRKLLEAGDVPSLSPSSASPATSSAKAPDPLLPCTPVEQAPLDPKASAELDALVDQVLAGDFEAACTQNTEVLSKKCVNEVACLAGGEVLASVLNSTVPGLSFAFNSVDSLLDSKRPFCGRAEPGFTANCVDEMIHGLVLDVWSNAKAITYDLPILAAQGTKAAWNALPQIDDEVSDALLAIASMDEDSLGRWFDDKVAFTQRFISGFLDAIDEGVRTSFGCELWTGIPYFSVCVKPMQAWGCASCTQRVQAICGVTGYLSGELVSAYLSGGAAAVGKAIAVAAARSVGTHVAAAAARNPKLFKALEYAAIAGDKVARGGALTVEALKTAYTATANALSRIRHSSAVSKTLELRSVVYTGKAVRIVFYPATKYLDLIGKAAELGYLHGDGLMTAAKTTNGMILVENALTAGARVPIDPVQNFTRAEPPDFKC